jgi:hypothetical protein
MIRVLTRPSLVLALLTIATLALLLYTIGAPSELAS